jgi:hypothetical protein
MGYLFTRIPQTGKYGYDGGVKSTTCCLERRAGTQQEQGNPLRRFFRDRGFVPVDAEAYQLFRHFARYSLLQEMSAPIIASWSFAYHGLYRIVGGCLCTVYFHDEKPVYFTLHRVPDLSCNAAVNTNLTRVIDTLYGLCHEAGLPHLQIRFIDEQYLGEFREIPGYHIETLRRPQDDEYAYRVADLLELSGTVNFYKRKRIRRCAALPGMSLRPMTNANVGDCLIIEDRWCKGDGSHPGKDCAYCASFGGCERDALDRMVGLFDEKVHQGLLLYVGDEPSGYVICEQISEKLAFLYFGKAVMEGFFVFLIYHMFRDHLTGVEYMNINEDMGSPGLQLFKSHLSAHELWPKYICTYTHDGERDNSNTAGGFAH